MSANQVSETQETYAKQQLGATQRGKGALLGVPWDKEKDTIEVKFPGDRVQPTKRNLLTKLANVYDPLGFASPTTLSGKLLYRTACELKIAWDAELPKEQAKQLSLWEEGLPPSITVPRPLTAKREAITNIDLHCFGDASGRGGFSRLVCCGHTAIWGQRWACNCESEIGKARPEHPPTGAGFGPHGD